MNAEDLKKYKEDRKARMKSKMRCIFCGDEVVRYGPETWHFDSGLIGCPDGEHKAKADI